MTRSNAPAADTDQTALEPMAPGPRIGLSLTPLAVDVRSLAAMLGLSERSIRIMDAAGKLPCSLKLGVGKCGDGMRVRRWSVAEVAAWLEAGAPDRETWHEMRRRLPT